MLSRSLQICLDPKSIILILRAPSSEGSRGRLTPLVSRLAAFSEGNITP